MPLIVMHQSRIKHYLTGLGSSYILLVVNIIYSFVSIPLALNYLGKSTFGLWALTAQLGLVLQVADAGLSGALVRLLIDYKDNKEAPPYRETLYTVWFALSIIALGIQIAAFTFSDSITRALGIPSEHLTSYPTFLSTYCAIFALMFLLKPISIALQAHQRVDLINWTSAFGLFLSLPAMWLGLELGLGLWSLLAGQIIATALGLIINYRQALRLALLPKFHFADCLKRHRLIEVASYGWQRLISTAGYTVILTAPTFLITRTMGLDATAAWSVGTRMQQLALQFTGRIPDVSAPALTEMHVRGEDAQLLRRLSELMNISGGLSIIFAGTLIACNVTFIDLWTNHRVQLPFTTNALISISLLVLLAQKLFWIPVSVSKNLGFTKYMPFLEASLMALILFLWPSDTLSLTTIAAALLVAGAFITLPAYVIQASINVSTPALVIIRPFIRLLLQAAIPNILLAHLIHHLTSPTTWLSLIVCACISTISGIALCLTIPNFREPIFEVLKRIPRLKKHLA